MTKTEIQSLKDEIRRLENRALDMIDQKKTSMAKTNHQRLCQLKKKLERVEAC